VNGAWTTVYPIIPSPWCSLPFVPFPPLFFNSLLYFFHAQKTVMTASRFSRMFKRLTVIGYVDTGTLLSN
jgi:hypothetical protein